MVLPDVRDFADAVEQFAEYRWGCVSEIIIYGIRTYKPRPCLVRPGISIRFIQKAEQALCAVVAYWRQIIPAHTSHERCFVGTAVAMQICWFCSAAQLRWRNQGCSSQPPAFEGAPLQLTEAAGQFHAFAVTDHVNRNVGLVAGLEIVP